MATSIAKCSICQEALNNPRLLPCIHSFCLECLKQYCTDTDKLPGDEVPCPECRTQFEIPKKGVAGLTPRTLPKPVEVCEACSSDEFIVPATVYCDDCSQKLCERCSVPHMKLRGGPHDVKPLDAMESTQWRANPYCDTHRERVRMYCFDCRINVCSTCCFEEHKSHKFDRIDTVSQQFVESIDDDIKWVTSRVESFRGVAAQVKAEKSRLLKNVEATEQKISNRGAKVQQIFVDMVDGQVCKLLTELHSLKSAAVKEVTSHTDTLELALRELESFRTSSLELRSKGSPSDITQAANDVHERAKELLETYVIPSEYHAPSYEFTPAGPAVKVESLRNARNFIGHVHRGEDRASSASTPAAATTGAPTAMTAATGTISRSTGTTAPRAASSTRPGTVASSSATTTGMAMGGDQNNYHYTVSSLLHEAGRHRRSDHPHGHSCGPNLANCQCENYHVIELRMVVAALNQLPYGTYDHPNWQRRLVDFFNVKHHCEEMLPHDLHMEKTHAVDKWLRGEYLSDEEMEWINKIREVWRKSRDQLKGFPKFKQALTFDVLEMS